MAAAELQLQSWKSVKTTDCKFGVDTHFHISSYQKYNISRPDPLCAFKT